MKTFVSKLKKLLLINTMLLLFLQSGAGGNYPLLHCSSPYIQASYSLLAIPSKEAHVSFYKQYKNALRKYSKTAGDGPTILVVIGTVLLSLIFLLFLFVLAYAGASNGVVLAIGIAGIGLIIWGAIALLRSIRRKREKALTAPKTE